MTTTEKKTITITMSETAPVKVDPEQWPKIASASSHDGQVECQANTEWYIAVRGHEDGRRIVYGWQQAGHGGKPAGYRRKDAGYLIATPATEELTIRAIRRVAGVIGDEALGAECIGDLPAQEI